MNNTKKTEKLTNKIEDNEFRIKPWTLEKFKIINSRRNIIKRIFSNDINDQSNYRKFESIDFTTFNIKYEFFQYKLKLSDIIELQELF